MAKEAVKSAAWTQDKSLAGQSVKQGNYTVRYDDQGRQVARIKDGGASATSTKKTTQANNSATHQAMYQAAQSGDWDKVGSLSSGLAVGNDMAAANQYVQELQDEFRYDPYDYYGASRPSSSRSGSAGGSVSSGYGSGSYSGGAAGGYGDLTQYLSDMYAQNLQAELAALKSAYDQNVTELNRQNERIAEQYRAARNQTAGQSALDTQRLNELFVAQGLNTGATGQMALSQSMAQQGNLGNLWAQEAQSQADVDLMRAQLMNQYNSGVQQATAQSNAQLSQALYNELLRQQELAAQQAQLDREWAWQERLYQDQLAAQAAAAAAPQEPLLSYSQMMSALGDGLATPSVTQAYEYYMGAPYDASVLSTLRKSSGSSSGGGSSGGSGKPTLTAAQTLSALESGVVNGTTRAAYQYYFGEPYQDVARDGSGVSNIAKGWYTDLFKNYLSQSDRLDAIEREYNNGNGWMTQADYLYLIGKLGLQ